MAQMDDGRGARPVPRKRLPVEEAQRAAREQQEEQEAAMAAQQRQADDAALQQALARQLTQSAYREFGGGSVGPDELALDGHGRIPFADRRQEVAATTERMASEGIGAMEARTILRQHEADLANAAADPQVSAVHAEQLGFMASSHRRAANAWERGRVEAGELPANEHLPTEVADLFDEQVEMETLREGLSLASGIQFAEPGELAFDVPGYDEVGRAVEAVEPEQGVASAAVRGFAQGASARLQVERGGLGPRARARMERHPELAEAAGPVSRMDALEARTAWPEPEAQEGPGLGRR